MQLIYEDKEKRTIKNKEEIRFSNQSAYHLIILTARAKSEKQISESSTDDEELTFEIDDKIFPKLGSDSKNVLDSPASINGGKSHNLLKTVYFLTYLSGKDHKITLKTDNPPGTATFESLEVYTLDLTDTLTLEPKIQAEDGDRREWITFVLDNLALNAFTIEFWADRMSTLEKITFSGLTTQPVNQPDETIQEKIRRKAKEFGLDPEMILRLVERESTFNPKAISPVGAKGLFQLTDDTIKQIAILGFKIDDPYDVDQNIQGGLIYFKWLYDRYLGDPEHLEKTLAAWNWGLNKFPKEGPLDYEPMPDETKEFIRYVLNK